MSGWLDTLFGNLPPPSPPARPASRGATFGANYQGLPTSPNVDDRQQQGEDYRVGMKRSRGDSSDYWPTEIPGADPWGRVIKGGYDPLVASPYIVGPTHAPGAYPLSYHQNLPATPLSFDQELPSPRTGFNTSNDVPYIGPHLPISPGDPGWTSPPSLSGPHNPGGDPNRPGYGAAIGMPMNTSSPPPQAASQPSYQQMIDFLQSWRGGTS